MSAIATDSALVERARGGDLGALDALLRGLQRPLYNLALRVLGRREDAQDATQEVLVKVATHLGTWRGESAFGTWVYAIASHHLLNVRLRSPARAELSFEELGLRLDRGEAYAQRVGWDEAAMSAEDRVHARRTALACTQAMLMCLDPPGRLAYVLDVVFGLPSPQAAEVQGITPAAHRQRLARARAAVHGFMEKRCGLVDPNAPCRCARQVPSRSAAAARGTLPGGLEVGDDDLAAAEHGLRELVAMGDAAAVMRGSPQYAPPKALTDGIRRIVEQALLFKP